MSCGGCAKVVTGALKKVEGKIWTTQYLVLVYLILFNMAIISKIIIRPCGVQFQIITKRFSVLPTLFSKEPKFNQSRYNTHLNNII